MDQPVVGDIEVGLEVAGHDGEAKGHNGYHGVEPGRLELIRRHAESIQKQTVARFNTSPHYMHEHSHWLLHAGVHPLGEVVPAERLHPERRQQEGRHEGRVQQHRRNTWGKHLFT